MKWSKGISERGGHVAQSELEISSALTNIQKRLARNWGCPNINILTKPHHSVRPGKGQIRGCWSRHGKYLPKRNFTLRGLWKFGKDTTTAWGSDTCMMQFSDLEIVKLDQGTKMNSWSAFDCVHLQKHPCQLTYLSHSSEPHEASDVLHPRKDQGPETMGPKIGTVILKHTALLHLKKKHLFQLKLF